MSRAVAVVKPLCGLARVVSETQSVRLRVLFVGRWRVATSTHREVVIYVYTAMVSSDVSTHAITAQVQGITYLQNHRSDGGLSGISTDLQRPPPCARGARSVE